MAITITVTGETAAEVRANIEALLNGSPYRASSNVSLVGAPTGKEVIPVATEETPKSVTVAEIAEPEKKERKPREAKKKEEAKVEAPTPPPAETPSTEEPTLDNCRNWIKAIAAKKTLEDAQKVVTGFGVAKVGDLPESKFPDFISECKKVLEAKEGDLFE